MSKVDIKVSQKIMRRSFLTLVALVLPVVAGCKSCEGGACAITACETGKTLSESGGGVITTSALKTLTEAGTPLVLLDARSGKYDDGRRILEAKSLNAGSSADEIAKVIKTKEELVVTYCSNPKCPASGLLAEHLRGLGYKNILEYSEGIAGWTAAGHKVKEAKR